jgi:hypothetical protein
MTTLLKITLFAAVLLDAVVASAAAPTQLPLNLKPSDAITASWVEDDGSGALTVRGADGTSSLVFFGAGHALSRIPAAAKLADRLRRVGGRSEGRFFATSASGGESYAYVLLERRNDRMDTVWSSTNLALARNAQPHVAISDDGRMWAAVAETSKRTLTLHLGAIPSYEPLVTIESRMTAEELRGGSDQPIVTWIRSDRKQPLVVVTWYSIANLFGTENGGKSVRSTLDAYPVSAVRWQSSAGILWAQERGAWTGFTADTIDRAVRTRTPAKAARRLGRDDFAGRVVAFEPLADRGLAVVSVAPATGRRTITTYDFLGHRPVRRNEKAMVHRVWQVSPSANVVLTLPAPAKNRTAFLQVLRTPL